MVLSVATFDGQELVPLRSNLREGASSCSRNPSRRGNVFDGRGSFFGGGSSSREGIPIAGDLPGETVWYSFQCRLRVANTCQCDETGELKLTNFRLLFTLSPEKKAAHRQLQWATESGLLDVPLGCIFDLSLENGGFLVSKKDQQRLKISTKDFRCLVFEMKSKEAQPLYSSLSSMVYPGDASRLFAFAHGDALKAPSPELLSSPEDRHPAVYCPEREFERMGIDTPSQTNPKCPWVFQRANAGYELCTSYPEELVVPRGWATADLAAIAKFRRKGRIPTLSWCGGPDMDYASLWRCSQPENGFKKNNSCPQDQEFLTALRRNSKRFLRVLDLRSETAAWGNTVTGGGFEDYCGCRLEFGRIGNIHDVSRAWNAMGAAVASVNDGEIGTWFRDVVASCWYDIMGNILRCGVIAVQEVWHHRSSLVIHCSDGWDRTAQVTALAALCLDPYLRTRLGFLNLIQRDFCSFGHLFRTRLAQTERATEQFSPVFLQWLEVVYQVMKQYPEEFEFNEDLLLRLADEVLSRRYGAFLFDTEQEWRQVQGRTCCLWKALAEESELLSDTYNPSPVPKPLMPNISQVHIDVWKAYWFRYHPQSRRMRRSYQLSSGPNAVGTPAASRHISFAPLRSHADSGTQDDDTTATETPASSSSDTEDQESDVDGGCVAAACSEGGVAYVWLRVRRGDAPPPGAVLAGPSERDGVLYVGRYIGEAGKVNTEEGALWNVWTPSLFFRVPDGSGEILSIEDHYEPHWIKCKKGDLWPEGEAVEAGSTFAARVTVRPGFYEPCKVSKSADGRVTAFVARDSGSRNEGEILFVARRQNSMLRSIRAARRGSMMSSFFVQPTPQTTRIARSCGRMCRVQ